MEVFTSQLPYWITSISREEILFYAQITRIYPTTLYTVGTQYMQILIIMML